LSGVVMGSIEILLDRVRVTIGQFVRLPEDLSDIGVLKSQIEMRQRVLEEIDIIRRRLKAFDLLRGQAPQSRVPKSASARAGRARNLCTRDGRRAARLRGQASLGHVR
jgi:hypothetical protein